MEGGLTVVVIDTTAMTSRRVAADGAVFYTYDHRRNLASAAVVDTAAIDVGQVAAKSAVAYRHAPGQIANASAVAGRVSADSTIVDCQRRTVKVKTRVENAPAVVGRVSADGAVGHCQRRQVAMGAGVEDAATAITKAVGDCETGDGDIPGEIFKDAESGVAVDRQRSGTGTIDVTPGVKI